MVIFFESNHTSRDGLAISSVVMNRPTEISEYGDTVCGVVGQKGQFAPEVLSRSMNFKALPDVQAAADSALKGDHYPKIAPNVMFSTRLG